MPKDIVSDMRAWFVALAATIWAVMVSAGILLYASFGYCLLFSDPSRTNSLVCSIAGTTWYYDIVTLVAGVPVLILIDHVARNPSRLDKPLSTRVMYLWMTLTAIFVLQFISAILPEQVLPSILVLWLGLGLTWATILVTRTWTNRVPKKTSEALARAC